MDSNVTKDDHDAFQGGNLNENTWVPFNDETQVPPRPAPTINQPQEEVPQPVAPQYIQHPYMEMMPPPPQEDKGWVTQIQQIPISTVAIIFGMGLLLGFMMTNRRPIILSGSAT